MDFSRDIHSVSRLVSEARAVLETGFPVLWVRGEVSNLSQPSSGHLYFSLKDAGAQVRCALWRSKRQRLAFDPVNGQQVLARAQVSLYEPRGEFQLLIEQLEPDGEGVLRLDFERLKQRLAAEGLFDAALKRPLPLFPRQVGLITSPSGAAVRDLITVLGRRFPALPVLIYPALVQGEAAPESLLAALELANARAECDVLILARGGGSLEDLNAFNDERLARAMRASGIPVVSGVGHEIDFTLADLAADQRAATPSAAAELVAPSGAHLRERVGTLSNRLLAAQRRRLDAARRRLSASRRHLGLLHPSARIQQQVQRLDRAEWRLRTLITNRIAEARQRLLRTVAGLEARSPLGTLSRGYAILSRRPEGEIVRDPAQVAPGDQLQIRVAGGLIEAVATLSRGQ
jgi:exodeoxyribonuclease VII large subunit